MKHVPRKKKMFQMLGGILSHAINTKRKISSAYTANECAKLNNKLLKSLMSLNGKTNRNFR